MTIHYLSATAVNTPDGVRHMAFCGVLLVYEDKESHVVSNYSSPGRVTCFRCVVNYARTYPQPYRNWMLSERRLRADKAAGIEYDWSTGQFLQHGKVMS